MSVDIARPLNAWSLVFDGPFNRLEWPPLKDSHFQEASLRQTPTVSNQTTTISARDDPTRKGR